MMPAKKDLTGKRFGKLKVIKESDERDSCDRILWVCNCDCGNDTLVQTGNLNSGTTKSCGCLQREAAKKTVEEKLTTHGFSHKERLYTIWESMRGRCKDLNNKTYGGKGIEVCEEWNSYSVFRKWALNNGYKNNLTIDRINSNENYEPSNCKWSTYKQQANNIKTNIILSYEGKTQTAMEWADELGMAKACFYSRYYRGWGIKKSSRHLLERSNNNLKQEV